MSLDKTLVSELGTEVKRESNRMNCNDSALKADIIVIKTKGG